MDELFERWKSQHNRIRAAFAFNGFRFVQRDQRSHTLVVDHFRHHRLDLEFVLAFQRGRRNYVKHIDTIVGGDPLLTLGGPTTAAWVFNRPVAYNLEEFDNFIFHLGLRESRCREERICGT